jgi:hypothetical protein
VICEACRGNPVPHLGCPGGNWCDCQCREGIVYVNIYCDNYSTCNAIYLDRHGDAEQRKVEERARTKGWHIYHGTTIGGAEHNGTLCPRCASSRKPHTQAENLSGDVVLFELEGPHA